MSWLSKAVSAVKSAVTKAVNAVKTVVTTVKNTISSTINTATTAVSNVVSSVVSSISSTVSKVTSSVSSAVSNASSAIQEVVHKTITAAEAAVYHTKEVVEGTMATIIRRAEETVDEETLLKTRKTSLYWTMRGYTDDEADLLKYWVIDHNQTPTPEQVTDILAGKEIEVKVKVEAAPSWIVELLNKFAVAITIKKSALGLPSFDLIDSIYTFVTGKKLDEIESGNLKLKVMDWILPLNSMSKLIYGRDLDGKPHEFGTTGDYIELGLGLAAFVPVGKLAGIAEKLGSKGIAKLFIQNADEGAKLLKVLKPVEKTAALLEFSVADDLVKALDKLGIDEIAKLSGDDLSKLSAKLGKTGLEKLQKTNPTIWSTFFSKISVAEQLTFLEGLGATPAGLKTIEELAGKRAISQSSLVNWGRKVLRGMATDFRKRPLMTLLLGVFAVTEIPNYFNMRIFARNQVAENAGLSSEQITFPLNEKDNHFESLQYELGTAIKDENWTKANDIIKTMEDVRESFKLLVWEKATVLKQIGLYNSEIENIAYFDDIITRAKEEVQPKAKAVEEKIPETFSGIAREIIDGDSIRVHDTATNTTREIRLVGINSPETGEKGKAESKEWLSNQLWGRTVTVKVDPNRVRDQYNRILGTIYLDGVNINLKSLQEGMSFYYEYDGNKYVDNFTYSSTEASAKKEGKGIWGMLRETGSIGASSSPTHAKILLDDNDTELRTSETIKDVTVGTHVVGLDLEGYTPYKEKVTVVSDKKVEVYAKLEKLGEEEAAPEVIAEQIMFSIDSVPTGAKVYIDEKYTGHLTPTTEDEQKDVIGFWTEGSHKIRLVKGGYVAEQNISLVKGERLTLTLNLTGGLPPEEEIFEIPTPPIEEEKPPIEEVPPTPSLPVSGAEIPPSYTTEQEWALNDAFKRIQVLTAGKEIMSEEERKNLIEAFTFYTEEQKEVLSLLWRDLEYYTLGKEQLSDEEFKSLKDKYHLGGLI